MSKYQSKLLVIILLATSSILHATSVYAQTPPQPGIDLTISPSVLEINAKPGDKIQEKIRIRNNSDTPMKISIHLKKILSDNTNETPRPVDLPAGDEFSSWTKIDPASFTARPREWQDIGISINIPSTAGYGYSYALEINPTLDTSTKQSLNLHGKVLVFLLVDVKKDDSVASAKLISFQPKVYVNEFLPVNFLVQVTNTGNVHIKPRGNIFVQNSGQKEAGILEVNQTLGTILPDSKRTFASNWTDGFIVQEPVIEDGKQKKDSKGNPVTQLTINWNKLTSFRIGKYSANLIMVYDNGKRDVTLEGTTTFIVFPYRIIGGIILALIIFFFIIRFLLKFYIRNQIRKYQNK